MKSRLPLYILTVVLFSFIGCTKELSYEGGETAPSGSNFYATIDGNLWNADSLQLILVDSNGVTINGLSKTGGQISMILPAFKVGTYTLNIQSASYALYTNLLGNAANVYFSNTGTAGGTVTISSIDTVNHLVSGTFQFNLINPSDNTTTTITKGVFSYIPYSGNIGGVNHSPPSGSVPDTLTAIIDGNNFIAVQIETTTTNGQLYIGGIASDGTQSLALIMPVNITPGPYSLDFTSGIYIGVYFPSPSVTLVSQKNGARNLTIISNDTVAKRITGTFSFKASSLTDTTSANITQGYFAITYQ